MKAHPTGAAAVLALATLSLSAWAAPANQGAAAKAKAPAPEKAAEPKVDARRIWPADLERIAGRYTFAQVASPGGFWERAG